MNHTQIPHKKHVDARAAIAVATGIVLMSSVAVSLPEQQKGQLIAQEQPVAEAPASGVPTEGEPIVVSSEERMQRFEDIVRRTHENYASLHSLIAQDIERDLEQQLHGSAPAADQLKALREQRWEQGGMWWQFMLDEVARWFGLER